MAMQAAGDHLNTAGPPVRISRTTEWYDEQQGSAVIDFRTMNDTGGLTYHSQIWIDTPRSVEAKVRWARAEGMAGGACHIPKFNVFSWLYLLDLSKILLGGSWFLDGRCCCERGEVRVGRRLQRG